MGYGMEISNFHLIFLLWWLPTVTTQKQCRAYAVPGSERHCSDICKIWACRWFNRWNVLMKDMAKVITFLVGFYVSTNVRRWWDQVTWHSPAAFVAICLADKSHPEALLHNSPVWEHYGWDHCWRSSLSEEESAALSPSKVWQMNSIKELISYLTTNN